MSRANILFADNDLDFLSAMSEFLEQEGYLVVAAGNPTEARRKLELGDPVFDLAIVDIRLREDEDDKDVSGILLARDVARSVPKIILTGYISWEYVRDVLRTQFHELPAAVDFVTKKEGREELLRAVRRALNGKSLITRAAASQVSQREDQQTMNSMKPNKEEKERPDPIMQVFIVHGRGGGQEKIAHLIELLGLHPVILEEEPNRGRTIIEKFEGCAKVGFAVVLMTPDDVGGISSPPALLQQRVRQNVLFELGYFVASLGRGHVCLLYTEGVEIPSDLQGIIYVSFEVGDGWKWNLARELRAANLPVDLNRIG